MIEHGINVTEQATSVSTPLAAETGVPYVVGAAPVQCAAAPAKPGQPVLCTSWTDAVTRLGYSEDWESYSLCEFMYSHFKLFAAQPVVFCNVLDPAAMQQSVESAEHAVEDHKVKLPEGALNDETLVVKASADGEALLKGTDYDTYYADGYLVVELLEGGACYDAVALQIAYTQADPTAVTETSIAAGLESVELCLTLLGVVPDLLCAPGWSQKPAIAAVMAAKADGINGLFRAKALVDIDCGADGARIYSDVQVWKNEGNLVDSDQILCWPMVQLDGRKFHLSTQLAGLMAQVDAGNGCPYESPSNKNLQCSGLVLEDGTEVLLTLTQANVLNKIGVVTALNLMTGWTAWGNYTACYPTNSDVKDHFIPVSRMFGWVGNSIIRTYWKRLDKPMNRRLIDSVKDSVNIWLNGLVSSEYLLGARVEILGDENPEVDLMAGIIRFHLYLTPPSPAQQIDFILEYDASYVAAALGA